ncbi:tRNA glutamyl-Q(34) synthetase GluQRS [Tumebacillus flagellatus]|uniref:Glutamyl-Q tRNA(Asp) synthetase n=1 Tax=Tumebacillus flagellatus TaxID=1157490 RepID=A0A074LMT4_9BACL|nr:tRNA glutamyl-Q(34) synthetase GluQRS [Tumebacillus flagellatus]KEO81835.1 glutamyl-Q tRNA(Asp) ligase [Tumebacillus flagellatus]
MRRGRFAPTPSGRLHIGNAQTALLAWLQMRAVGGEFVLRMEDIDRPRCKPEYAEQMLDDLRWLGLDWDEGPDTGGPHAPYVQSQRVDLYEQAVDKLWQDGRLYPCYCSRAELHGIAGAPHGLTSEGPVYLGTCRNLSPEERAAKEKVKTPSWRFKLPEHPLAFTDGVLGEQHVPAGAGGDFVVKRADGIFSYQIAVVVDDALMGITDVLRGADLLDSTPRQLLLYEALSWQAPQFAHVPMLHGPDGARLSKRDGAVMLTEMRQAGTRPEKLLGWLAYWCGLLDRPEPVQASDLIPAFDLAKLAQAPVSVTESALRDLM